MNGFEHPGTIQLIHDMEVRAELQRDRREYLRGEYLPRPQGGRQPSRLRIAISQGLIALARRIEPNEPASSGTPAAAWH